MGINEADMDKYCCPNTVMQALKCTFIVWPTIMDHYKDIYLSINLLFVNTIQILLMIPHNLRFIQFKTLLSNHNKYMQNRLQQFVQSRGFKNVSTVVDRAFDNMVD